MHSAGTWTLAERARGWWDSRDKPGWRNFAIAMLALGVAMLLALYAAAAAALGRQWLAGAASVAALALAGWVGFAIVPVLARRTPLRWLTYHIDFKLTREGIVYVAGVFAIALAALNTGNNLLFMMLAALLAGISMSGILSNVSLSGVELRLALPEHIFAWQAVQGEVALRNDKLTLPSFSLRVSGDPKAAAGSQILSRPVYFPYLPKQRSVRQQVELVFPRRGVYRQDAFGISTRFPFGFLEKTRKVGSTMEVVVYPAIERTEEFYEILPLLSGEIESTQRGRGHDLYSIRDYAPSDSARFVDWKATARTGGLKVREFTREDERQVLLVLDPVLAPDFTARFGPAGAEEKFERAVNLAACLAWHFYEIDSELQFRAGDFLTRMAPAGEIIYDVLRRLATIAPARDAVAAAEPAADDSAELFKIILTSRPRGSIPTSLWATSYFVFMDAL
jgi:uncharacterized protein (DUF58 family)